MAPPDVIHASIRQLKVSAGRHGRDGEDLVQEALTRAVANGVPLSAVPWLQTVTRRLAIDRARRSRELASGGAVDLEKFVTDVGMGPEDEFLSSERRREIREALEALPDRYRQALLAWAEDGAGAVSRRLGTSPGATWTLLSRARDRLRRELDRVGVVPSVVGVRLQRWWASLCPCGLALGVVVTLAVPSPRPAVGAAKNPMRPSDRGVVAVEAAPPRVQPVIPHATSAKTETKRAPGPVAAAAPARTEPSSHFKADVGAPCTAKTGPMGVDLRLEDDEEDSLSGKIVSSLPSELRDHDREECKGS